MLTIGGAAVAVMARPMMEIPVATRTPAPRIKVPRREASRTTRRPAAMTFALLAGMTAVMATVAPTLVTRAAAADISGTWATEGTEALIRVAPCGGGALCGSVAWLREPLDPQTGKPKLDVKNPDPAQRSKPLIGSHVFYDMRPSGADQWSGKIYSVDDGLTVNGQLISKGPDQLRIQGCLLGICSGQDWVRSNAGARAKRGKT
jgi:uncharacterized protein (DUF2147 family)